MKYDRTTYDRIVTVVARVMIKMTLHIAKMMMYIAMTFPTTVGHIADVGAYHRQLKDTDRHGSTHRDGNDNVKINDDDRDNEHNGR